MRKALLRLLPAVLCVGAASAQSFQDVPSNTALFPFVQAIARLGITRGCSTNPPLYCPDAPVTRGQALVFIVRSLAGENFETSPNPYFADVPSSHMFFRYIQRARELGITVGCDETTDVAARFCPDEPVDRQTAALFLIRAKVGQGVPVYSPQFFTDVLPVSPYYPFVQKLRELRITSGCSTTRFCPTDPVTRGQMAVFIIRSFFT